MDIHRLENKFLIPQSIVSQVFQEKPAFRLSKDITVDKMWWQ